MTLGSDAARNDALDATLGDGATAGSFPDPLYLALFAGDPTAGGTEITLGTGGYARKQVNAADWELAGSTVNGEKANDAEIAFDISTAAWEPTDATHCALMDAPTGGTLYDTGALDSTVSVPLQDTTVTFPVGALTVTQA